MMGVPIIMAAAHLLGAHCASCGVRLPAFSQGKCGPCAIEALGEGDGEDEAQAIEEPDAP